jgi:carbon storage regulator CsrA
MLVLTRGPNDKVIFPTLGISVEILRVAGSKVRLGINAPSEVPVHRHEVAERMEAEGAGGDIVKFPPANISPDARLNYATRDRLNAAALGLHLLHRKLETGDLNEAEGSRPLVLQTAGSEDAGRSPACRASRANPGVRNTSPKRKRGF